MSWSSCTCSGNDVCWSHGMGGGITGAVGWMFAGRVIVMAEGVGMTGGYKKFVDPGPGS